MADDRQVVRNVPGAVLALVILLPVAGCADSGSMPTYGPTSVAAYPDLPHVDGPLRVRLQPALPLLGADSCTPGGGWYCLGEQGYRALGEERTAVVAEVSTGPNDGHTAWDVTVRFDGAKVSRLAEQQAAGMGGLVLVLGADDRALAAVPPPDMDAGEAQVLGLEKAEAWALVEAFSRSTESM